MSYLNSNYKYFIYVLFMLGFKIYLIYIVVTLFVFKF